MPLTRKRKEELLDEYRELVQESAAIIYTEYTGIPNRRLTELRNKIRDAGGVYKVTKLTLLRIALEEAEMPIPEDFSGVPLAMIFAGEDLATVAKAVNDAAEEMERVNVRGAIMGESVLTPAEVEKLEDLPTMDEVRASLVGLLVAPQTQLVTLLQTPQSELVNVMQAGVTSVLNVLQAYINENEGQAA